MTARDVPASPLPAAVTEAELLVLLGNLIEHWEDEVVEFKEASAGYSVPKIGQYFSALSNEANLRNEKVAWLVFGVSNRTREVVGTDFRPSPDQLQKLKQEIAQDSEPRSTFRNIYDLAHPDGRVLLFEIPTAPRGIPIARQGQYYARNGESLSALSLDKQDEIRNQTLDSDWSAEAVSGAVLDDLDNAAIERARISFARKYSNRFSENEVAAWPLETFLDRAKLTKGGLITRATILLLGKPESAWKLSPHPGQITWNLVGEERAYEHFHPPFLLATSSVFQKLRNVQIRLLPEDQLIPEEVSKYDQQTVLEALHNCVAHQDYRKNARIVLTEQNDRLILENSGSFFEGAPSDYLSGERVPLGYRNPALVQAMVELNMIDQMGYGIHRMNDRQARRYLPLPDYDLSDPERVKLTIYGGVVNPAYTSLLLRKTGLPFIDVLALDRVQKGVDIPDEALRRLRKAKLVEGRRPNLYVAAQIAAASDSKAQYIRTRAQDDVHYAKLLLDYLDKFKSATRQEIDQLLLKKLSDSLDDGQKTNKIGNLLTKLKRDGKIVNKGSRSKPQWVRTNAER